MKDPFRATYRPPTKRGAAGYDNPRENIDPHLKTQAFSTSEMVAKTGVFSGNLTALNLSGNNTGDQDLSGLVPYVSATDDLDLGTNDLFVNEVGIGTSTLFRELNLKGEIQLESTTPPSSACTHTLGGAGNVNDGVHRYKVAYYTDKGSTELSNTYLEVTITDKTTNGQVLLANIPVSADDRVIGRRIYRGKAGLSTSSYYFLTEIANNTTTTYTDNAADADIGTADHRNMDNFTSGAIYRDNVRMAYLGENNCGIGFLAMGPYTAPTGYFNFGLGNRALYALTTGSLNTSVGTYAGYNVTTASNVTSIGSYSNYACTTGYDNVAVGASALHDVNTTRRNVAVGSAALYKTVTNYNVGVGHNAGYNITSGSGVIAIGNQALYNGTTCTGTIAIGHVAAYSPNAVTANACTSSLYGVFIGMYAGLASPTQRTNAIAIGYRALVDDDNACCIGGTGANAVKVGIGVTAPSAWLHLPAGTATVAPLKFTTGTALTTETAGTLEYHDDRLYLTNVAVRRAIDRTSDVITSTTTVSNTTTETTIYTGTIGSNALKVGNILKLNCGGLISNNSASDDITIKMYFGTSEILSFNAAIGNVTDEPWYIDGHMTTRTVGASGTCACTLKTQVNGFEEVMVVTSNIDTTTAQNFTVTVQWDNAKADNIISIYQGFTEWKN